MVAHTTRPGEPAKAGPGTAKLADIQGLRALCVIAVVLNHLTSRFHA